MTETMPETPSQQFAETVVLITGASKGLGHEVAAGFVARGASVICSSRTEETLDEAVTQLPDGPGEAVGITADVRDESSVAALFEAAHDAFGRVDVLVNNAGVSEIGLTGGDQPPIHELPTEVWDTVIDTNLRGVFLCTRAVLPGMLERGRGMLIHVSSGMGVEGRKNRAAYVSSKFGLEGFHESVADELEGTGVDSVILDPGGGVNTEGFSAYLSDEARAARLEPDVVVEPTLRLAAGAGENGGRYVATDFP